MTSPPSTPLHPRAVLLARVFLVCFGLIALAVGLLMGVGVLESPSWWAPVAAAVAGAALLLTALFDSSAGTVGTFLIFFSPWN